ncbi:uncharacterized protein MELLADRAFT_90930 [Melampsora larici-populina 98AG31]|uniref:Uncharacterized protein n=1 Tax=Melampsora larici-populina (strain 98AG31 / pathotype 3-4-7) TaxID=747676 RepID=F4R831_MELLP|nr:uncharacterized protein MELLADRAFT_90930 [Melampsora larici-populina 98AG31]EGG11425.1 hypothetical protein MELLADRAFT_90930 [Melampsora larici-populina 98AG31]
MQVLMADPTISTTHGLYLSGPFLIEARTLTENGWQKEYRTYTSFIACSGGPRDDHLHYEIVAQGFGHINFKLEAGHIYFLRGSFFPTNDKEQDNTLFFEASDWVLLNDAENFVGDLVDAVGITGVGIICKIDSIIMPTAGGVKKNQKDENKPTTIVTVLHSDFHPTTKDPTQFMVEYHIPPTPNLAGTPKILKVGQEFQFHGFVKDYDPDNFRYVIIANKVSPTNGNKEYQVDSKGVKVKDENTKPMTLANKPLNLKSAFKLPVISTDSDVSTSLHFPPSDFGPHLYRSGSSSLTGPSSSNQSPDKLKPSKIAITALKERGRSQPKHSTKKGKTLNLTVSEDKYMLTNMYIAVISIFDFVLQSDFERYLHVYIPTSSIQLLLLDITPTTSS